MTSSATAASACCARSSRTCPRSRPSSPRRSRREMTLPRRNAKLCGRTPEGQPLARAPMGPDPEADYDYTKDPKGTSCPFGSHVRRMNPACWRMTVRATGTRPPGTGDCRPVTCWCLPARAPCCAVACLTGRRGTPRKKTGRTARPARPLLLRQHRRSVRTPARPMGRPRAAGQPGPRPRAGPADRRARKRRWRL